MKRCVKSQEAEAEKFFLLHLNINRRSNSDLGLTMAIQSEVNDIALTIENVTLGVVYGFNFQLPGPVLGICIFLMCFLTFR